MRLSRWLAGADGSLPVRRMRQQRLSGLPLGDQRTAMAIGHSDKAPGHVIAEERDAKASRRVLRPRQPEALEYSSVFAWTGFV